MILNELTACSELYHYRDSYVGALYFVLVMYEVTRLKDSIELALSSEVVRVLCERGIYSFLGITSHSQRNVLGTQLTKLLNVKKKEDNVFN
jgi:hypothetical protein